MNIFFELVIENIFYLPYLAMALLSKIQVPSDVSKAGTYIQFTKALFQETTKY